MCNSMGLHSERLERGAIVTIDPWMCVYYRIKDDGVRTSEVKGEHKISVPKQATYRIVSKLTPLSHASGLDFVVALVFQDKETSVSASRNLDNLGVRFNQRWLRQLEI